MSKDKRHRLCICASNVHNCEEDFRRIPLKSNKKCGDDSRDYGDTIEKIIENIPPLECTSSFNRGVNKKHSTIYTNVYLSKEKICGCMHTVFKRMGNGGWGNKHPMSYKVSSQPIWRMIPG